jgi:hypothetical protein
VELSKVAADLYGLPLREFTAARDAQASEARRAGDREFAESVKRLRKPSNGAWIVNRLVREQPREIDRLVELGTTLRSAKNLDGDEMRKATKEKAETVSKLLRQARTLAKRADLSFSQSIEMEVEGTLDAAFSDGDSASSLREGCLTTGLQYSGLGFGEGLDAAASSRKATRRNRDPMSSELAKAKRGLEQARSVAERADSEVEKAEQRIKTAEADLKRLRAALTVATRQATKAHEKASSAAKNLDLLRGKPRRA